MNIRCPGYEGPGPYDDLGFRYEFYYVDPELKAKGMEVIPYALTKDGYVELDNAIQINNNKEYDDYFEDLMKTHPWYKSLTKSYGRHIFITDSEFEASKKRMQFSLFFKQDSASYCF